MSTTEAEEHRVVFNHLGGVISLDDAKKMARTPLESTLIREVEMLHKALNESKHSEVIE